MKTERSDQLVNPFEQDGRWYKANLHTHTTTSDGDATVEERVRQYREQGYSVLAITDHEKTNDVSGLSTEDFLVISGIELHPLCENANNYHFVCLNVPHDTDFAKNADADSVIRRVKEVGGEVIFGHPYWCGHNVTHLLSVDGYIGIEVYNATCTRIGKGISSVHWDDLLDAGRMMPASACDDAHHNFDIFMGWTMIKCRELTVQTVMEALRNGCYYASSGPAIDYFRVSDGKAVVRCSGCTEVHFMCKRASGHSLYARGENLLSHAEFDLAGLSGYVRAEVVDERGCRAWTNPIAVT